MREYPRTSTTIANAYVQPVADRYLRRLADGLSADGINAPLNIMLSSGGTTTVDAARAFPVRLVESGTGWRRLGRCLLGAAVGTARCAGL